MTENELMLMSILKCRRVDLSIDRQKLTPAQQMRYNQMKTRRSFGEPLQYIIGQCEFLDVTLHIDRRALIPRPETEILTELAIERIKPISKKQVLKGLDLGTGSGNIAIALLKNISSLHMTAVDVSDEALALAEKNAGLNKVDARAEFVCDNLCSFLKRAVNQAEAFDFIISNPPYIPSQQLPELPVDVRHEPRMALDGGADGLKFYHEIIKYSWQIISDQGFIAMEIGDGQRRGIEAIFAQYPQYSGIKFYRDYVGTDRIVIARRHSDAERSEEEESQKLRSFVAPLLRMTKLEN